MIEQPLRSSSGKLQQSSINDSWLAEDPCVVSGTRRVARRQRHPFMVAAGWVIAVALLVTAVPCCLIYLGVRAAGRFANRHVSRLRSPGHLQH